MKRRRSLSVPVGILLGVVIAMVLLLTGAALLAYLILTERLPCSAVGYGSILILALAAMIGCRSAQRMSGGKRGIVSAATGLGILVLLLGIHWLFFEGPVSGFWGTAAAVSAGGAIASIPGVKGKRSGGKRQKISAYR